MQFAKFVKFVASNQWTKSEFKEILKPWPLQICPTRTQLHEAKLCFGFKTKGGQGDFIIVWCKLILENYFKKKRLILDKCSQQPNHGKGYHLYMKILISCKDTETAISMVVVIVCSKITSNFCHCTVGLGIFFLVQFVHGGICRTEMA